MESLKERIRTDGRVLGTEIVKVDSFLNHQLDPLMMQAIGREFAVRFAGDGVTKILTIEASGIAVALATALELKVPVLFAKKSRASTQVDGVYTAEVHSFTKRETRTITVSRQFMQAGERVLVLDDFLAHGEATAGLISLVEQAGAALVGVGIVVEKGFQNGGKRLREQGIRLESLAIIEAMSEEGIRFVEEPARV